MNRFGFRYMFVILFLICCVTISGCGPQDAPRGDITGSVQYKGQPVATGCVSLYSPTGGTGSSGDIQADGTFAIKGIPTGSYQVSIAPQPPVPPAPGETPKPQPKFVLPVKYADGASSGLTSDVKEGPNELKLDLK